MRLKLPARMALLGERALVWLGRKECTHKADPVEFRDVFDQVLEESDWVCLRAGALERSWRADRAKQN